MDPGELLLLILTITAVAYVGEQLLDYVNLSSRRPAIPDEMSAFYDPGKYARSRAYQRDRARFSFVTAAVSFVLSFGMLLWGGFGWLDRQVQLYFQHEIIQGLAFFAIVGFAADLVSTPFQCYATFVIEARYEFNKTTPHTFVADKLKGYLLAAVIGGPVLSLFFYMARIIGPGFWLWFSAVIILLLGAANLFYTTLFLPLYNKLTPLPDNTLKRAIELFARNVNFPLDNVFVIDGSRRSSKANAFFSGIGKRKKIVLYDTLIERHTTEELVAVLAHEVGHFKKKHIVTSFLLSSLQIVFMLFVLSRMLYAGNISLALGGDHWSMPLNLVAFGILFSPISGIMGLLMNILSRRNEFEADRFARDTFDATALSSALKRLSVDTLSDLYPHPAYVFFHYSHPPLLQRLKALAKHDDA
jgi:STE24 endopeptidase